MHFGTYYSQVSLDSDSTLQYLDDVLVESRKNENEMLGAVLPYVVI